MGSDFQPQLRGAPVAGLERHLPPELIPLQACVTCHNMRIRDGVLSKTGGWLIRTGDAVEGVPSLIAPLRFAGGVQQNIVATNRWIYRVDHVGTLHKLNTEAFEAGATDRWTADYLLGKWYFSNIVDGLFSYDGGEAGLVPVETGGFKGRFVTQFANHLLLANLATEDEFGQHQLAGSGLANGGDWDVAEPTSDAVLLDVPDDAAAFQGLRRVPGGLALYKENSIHLATYRGLPDVYTLYEAATGIGVLAPHTLIDNGAAHVFMGQDNLYAANGGQPVPLAHKIWRWWVDQIDKARIAETYAFHDPRHKEVLFVINPGDTGRALVWHYDTGVFTTRDFPFVAVGFVNEATIPTFDELTMTMDEIGNLQPTVTLENYALVGATAAGQMYTLEQADNAGGDWLTAELQTGTSGGGLPLVACGGLLVDVAELSGTPLQVFVSGRKSLGESPRWKGPYLYRGGDKVSCLVTGRYFDFKFVKPGGRFALRGFAPLLKVRQ